MRTPIRVIVVLVVLVIPVGLFLWLWRPAQPSGGAQPGGPDGEPFAKVRLQLNWVPEPEFGGFYAAQQEGRFAQHGLQVEILKGAAGTPAPQMAASGAVEFAIVSGDQILTLREQGGQLVALFSIFHTSPMGVMVKKSAPWTTLEQVWTSDLTVAMESGLPYIKFLNAKYGAGKVKVVPTGSGLAAFQQGTVNAQQCFISAEPVQMELAGIPVRVFSLAESGYDPYAAVVATSAAFLAEHRDLCERFVQATREGWLDYMANPAMYNVELNRLNPSMSVEAMNKAAQLQEPLIAGSGSSGAAAPGAPGPAAMPGIMTAERWQRLSDQMVELGLIAGGWAEPPSAATPAGAPLFWNVPERRK